MSFEDGLKWKGECEGVKEIRVTDFETDWGPFTSFFEDGRLICLSRHKNPLLDAQPLLDRFVKRYTIVGDDSYPPALQVKRQLDEYFAGQRREFTIPYTLYASPFCKRALEEVAKIPYGMVASYRDIALALGTRAYRAVGVAVKHNYLAIIIPCHRVISADGSIGGYSFYEGRKTKQRLLMLEGRLFAIDE